MAFVINPDGTIKILEVKYDRYGNISPKRIVDDGYGHNSSQPKKKKKKKKKHRNSSSLSYSFKETKKEVNVTYQSVKEIGAPEDATPIITPASEKVPKKVTPPPMYVTKTPEKKKLFQTKEAKITRGQSPCEVVRRGDILLC